jgi:hypothetical protein
MAIPLHVSPEEAQAWNYRVAFPMMGFRTLPPNAYGKIVGGAENITRPWPGVYRGLMEQGRTPIQSYQAPKTYQLKEFAPDAVQALKRLLGMP